MVKWAYAHSNLEGFVGWFEHNNFMLQHLFRNQSLLQLNYAQSSFFL